MIRQRYKAILNGIVIVGGFLVLRHVGNADPIVKVTIKVVNDEGLPVKGAKVHLGFGGMNVTRWRADGETNENGLFTGSDECIGLVTYNVTKEGFYDSYDFKWKWFTKTEKSKYLPWREEWRPWNPTYEILLKKKVKPVPMIVRRVQSILPLQAANSPVGFDLAKGDFTPPFGKGEIGDFIFIISGKDADWTKNPDDVREGKVKLKFSNPDDGIIVSTRPSDDASKYVGRFQTAPGDGYVPIWEDSYGRTLNKILQKDRRSDLNQNFVFRVRAGGEIPAKKPLYGKIHGAPYYGVGFNGVGIEFLYYLNPTGGRELEFDGKNNLANEGMDYKHSQTISDP